MEAPQATLPPEGQKETSIQKSQKTTKRFWGRGAVQNVLCITVLTYN